MGRRPRLSRPRPAQPGGSGREAGSRSQPAVAFDRVDRALARAAAQVEGWSSVSLRLPASPSAPIAATIDRGDGGQSQKRAVLTLNAESGEVVRWEPFSGYSTGRRFRSYLRFAHTGEVAGPASAGGAFLVVTGVSLAIRRAAARLRRVSLASPGVQEAVSAARSPETRRSSGR